MCFYGLGTQSLRKRNVADMFRRSEPDLFERSGRFVIDARPKAHTCHNTQNILLYTHSRTAR